MPVPTTAPPPRTLLRDRAYVQLRDAIVDGTLEPGEQLREHELQAWLGVSRTPIREALMRLQRTGLVLTRPGHSTTVAPLDDARVHDVQPVIAAMHATAVRLAVPLLADPDLTTMREANDAFAAALAAGDADAALAADDRLHEVCVEVAGNQVVRDVLDEHAPLLRRAERARFSSAAGAMSVELHATMIDACAAGDADRAAAIAQATWDTLADAGSTTSTGHGIPRTA
ncbi:GntR family transcriptional regulator [Nocardioides sp.]|uniref:GntR family transcriptional regulator n=1 Tax=Nocardioides sp. TaxID=35761 RepID=UPI002735A6F9|nr:GntR family transcriptional regulator [Nocardioides sp.]MDP3891854.1 GntR family transcriptional regulator [Nocardioides sp.]